MAVAFAASRPTPVFLGIVPAKARGLGLATHSMQPAKKAPTAAENIHRMTFHNMMAGAIMLQHRQSSQAGSLLSSLAAALLHCRSVGWQLLTVASSVLQGAGAWPR